MPVTKDSDIKVTKKDSPLNAALDNSNQPPKAASKQRPVGRPKTGKSSNSDYKQTSVYLKKETLKEARNKLFESDEDLSDILEKLLSKWLKT